MRRWKYGKQSSAERLLCEAFAGWIEETQLATEATAIIAVPMHRHKLRKRGFNTAYQLGKIASYTLKLPLLEKALQRDTLTESQAGLDKAARQQNLWGAFSVNTEALKGHRQILLIDDVYTTGATAQSCAQLLAHAGVEHLHLLTLARALPHH
jgi:ComF family protein